jgi:hypothetical protein
MRVAQTNALRAASARSVRYLVQTGGRIGARALARPGARLVRKGRAYWQRDAHAALRSLKAVNLHQFARRPATASWWCAETSHAQLT